MLRKKYTGYQPQAGGKKIRIECDHGSFSVDIPEKNGEYTYTCPECRKKLTIVYPYDLYQKKGFEDLEKKRINGVYKNAAATMYLSVSLVIGMVLLIGILLGQL